LGMVMYGLSRGGKMVVGWMERAWDMEEGKGRVLSLRT
jgi:hypothetical protein